MQGVLQRGAGARGRGETLESEHPRDKGGRMLGDQLQGSTAEGVGWAEGGPGRAVVERLGARCSPCRGRGILGDSRGRTCRST